MSATSKDSASQRLHAMLQHKRARAIAIARRGGQAVMSVILALGLCCIAPPAAFAEKADSEGGSLATAGASNKEAEVEGLGASQLSRSALAPAGKPGVVGFDGSLDKQLGYVNGDILAHVSELYQNPELPGGCESVSLAITLRAMGYDVGKTEIYDSYMSHSSWDYVNAFAGDARNMTGFGLALPPAIVSAANRYLTKHGAAERAVNLSGASFETLLEYVDKGYPVMVWTTIYMLQPKPWGMSLYGYRPYGNAHCVVLYGHGGSGVQISDPLSGKVTRDYGAFASLYRRCGCYAAVIV